MPGRVFSPYGSRSGTGADQRYVPLNPVACCFLSFVDRCGMLFANGCAGFIHFCYGLREYVPAWELLTLLVILFILRVPALLVYPLVCAGPELRRRAYSWTRPLGGGRRGYCFRRSLGGHQETGKCGSICGRIWGSRKYCWTLLYMPVFVRLPSLLDRNACMVFWTKWVLRGNCRQKQGKTSVSPLKVFLLCRNSLYRFWGVIVWHFWIGRATHPGPSSQGIWVEVFDVGGWLTHGDFALATGVDVFGCC